MLVSLGCRNKVSQHSLGSLNNRNLFLTVLEAESPNSRCQQGWFLLKPLSLAFKWLSSPCVPHGFASVCVCVLMFFKNSNHSGLEPTLYVSLFNAITSITTLPPNKVILWGLGLQQLLGEHSSTHNPSHSLVLFWLAPLWPS